MTHKVHSHYAVYAIC